MKMLTIRESVACDPKFAPSENYGKENMARISAKDARALCGMYPLPAIGYETCCAFNGRTKEKLYVANIGGVYVVRSHDVKVAHWGSAFGIVLLRK